MSLSSLLHSKNKDIQFRLSQLWVDALIGENEFADLVLFAALEDGDFLKAQQIYKDVFSKEFEKFETQEEAA